MTAPDMAPGLRAAIVGRSEISSLLPAYKGSFPVFTRRPVPDGAPYPLVMINPDASQQDQDGVSDTRIQVTRDIAVYGRNDTASHYVDVETIAYAIREAFHNQRDSFTVEGWHIANVRAIGPRPAPVDDEQTVGRVVSLTALLVRQP